MTKKLLDVESLEEFLAEAAPSFRAYLSANPRSYASRDNFYLLLAEFRDYVTCLFNEDRSSKLFKTALEVVNTLLERGNESVRDATVISIIDVIIRDDSLRMAALNSQLPYLSTEIRQQVANWEEFRRQHPDLIRPKSEGS